MASFAQQWQKYNDQVSDLVDSLEQFRLDFSASMKDRESQTDEEEAVLQTTEAAQLMAKELLGAMEEMGIALDEAGSGE